MGITYRLVKGSTLTYDELDANFAYLLPRISKLNMPGPMKVFTGVARWYPERSISLKSFYISLGVAGTAGTTVVLKKNGSVVGTAVCTATANKSSVVTLTDNLTISDYLTVDVTAAGAGASDLLACITYE